MDQDDAWDWVKSGEKRTRRQRRQRVARRAGTILGGLAAAVLVLVVTVPSLRSWLPAGIRSAAYPKQGVPAGVSVTSSQSARPTDPFAGTSAASYAKGTAGITLPAAKAVTGFSAVQVGAALQQVRKALVAGRLDHDMIVDHRPTAFLALLSPSSRDQIYPWFGSAKFESVATWIDPAVRLDPREQPRVSGRVTYSSVVAGGLRTLRVTTNFVWVYAFQVSGDHPLAVEHDEIRWEFPSTTNLRVSDRGMWLVQATSYSALVDCAASQKGLLAPSRGTGVAPAPSDTEDPDNYLKADHALDIGDGCGKAAH